MRHCSDASLCGESVPRGRSLSSRPVLQRATAGLLMLLLDACMSVESDVSDLSNGLTAQLLGVTQRSSTSEPMFVDVIVENPGSTLLVLLPWGTPFEESLSADVFTVRYAGEPVSYKGRLIKRSAPKASDYVELAGRESLEQSHDLAVSYDLSRPGTYTVSLKPSYAAGAAYWQNAAAVVSAVDDPMQFERY